MKNKYLIATLLLFFSCKHEEGNKQSSDSILLNEVKVQKEECKKDETDNIQPLLIDTEPVITYYDILDKESYIRMIKECVEFERQSNNMGLDSAILIYSDDLIPIDSIIKWWKNIP